jgi:predicted Zn finger-like uncharacterized protein
MLIQCPKCRTTYKVADDVLRGSASLFRCSRCKHTFELQTNEAPEIPAERPAVPETQSTRPSADQELSLPFTPKEKPPSPDSDEEVLVDFPAGEKNAEDPKPDNRDQWSLSDDDRKTEHPFTISDAHHSIGDDRALDASKDFSIIDRAVPVANERDRSESSNNILAISPYLDQRASILPFVTLFGLLVIGFSLIAVISQAHPRASEEIVKKIPVVGTSVLRNNHLKEGILIQSLQAGYQTIQGNREIFVVTGVAFNQNPVVVREIQLTGRIYNQGGKELERQTIWVGNTISPKIIRGMTTEDIPHLQNLKPLKSFEIPSGDSVPFTIVFLKSTKNAQDFTCEVVTAEGEV